MKVFLINSFRSMVYIAFFVIVGVFAYLGYFNRAVAAQEFGLSQNLAGFIALLIGAGIGYVVGSVVCGLIATILDIRDDINDRLPDARED
jgi:predicted aminopeptidase